MGSLDIVSTGLLAATILNDTISLELSDSALNGRFALAYDLNKLHLLHTWPTFYRIIYRIIYRINNCDSAYTWSRFPEDRQIRGHGVSR